MLQNVADDSRQHEEVGSSTSQLAGKNPRVTWKDKVSNEKLRQRTGLEKLEDIQKRLQLNWFGHANQMDDK
jgi:hypothetical protein